GRAPLVRDRLRRVADVQGGAAEADRDGQGRPAVAAQGAELQGGGRGVDPAEVVPHVGQRVPGGVADGAVGGGDRAGGRGRDVRAAVGGRVAGDDRVVQLDRPGPGVQGDAAGPVPGGGRRG